MKTFSKTQIKDIALRYAYDNNLLNYTNVYCFIAGFSQAQDSCRETLSEVLNNELAKERDSLKKYEEELSSSIYMFSRPDNYEETLRYHKKYLDALENLINVMKEIK